MEIFSVESTDEIGKSIGLTRIRFNVKFGRLLVDKGIVTDEEMEGALETQKLGRKNGANPLIGDIISRQYGVEKREIEKAFAEHLFANLIKHFQYVLLHDPALLSYFDAQKNFLEKMSIKIPFWEYEEAEKSLIKGMAIFQIKPKNHDEITVSLPFDYYIDDQVSNIDFIGAMEFVKSQVIDSKGGLSDFESLDIGIPISEIKNV